MIARVARLEVDQMVVGQDSRALKAESPQPARQLPQQLQVRLVSAGMLLQPQQVGGVVSEGGFGQLHVYLSHGRQNFGGLSDRFGQNLVLIREAGAFGHENDALGEDGSLTRQPPACLQVGLAQELLLDVRRLRRPGGELHAAFAAGARSTAGGVDGQGCQSGRLQHLGARQCKHRPPVRLECYLHLLVRHSPAPGKRPAGLVCR